MGAIATIIIVIVLGLIIGTAYWVGNRIAPQTRIIKKINEFFYIEQD